jgi:Flp pilus assembly protein TadG
MIRFPRLFRDRSGVGAVEFALAAPVLLFTVIGIAQLGILFLANAGLKNAVAEGARYATTHPRPNNTQITAKIADKRFGLNAQYLKPVTITEGTADGAAFVQISLTYEVPLTFIFMKTRKVTLTETRRAYVYPPI